MVIVFEAGKVGIRSRFQEWLESILPWYDQDRERAKTARYQQQLVESKRVRFDANHVVASSRTDRRSEMRASYHRATRRLAKR